MHDHIHQQTLLVSCRTEVQMCMDLNPIIYLSLVTLNKYQLEHSLKFTDYKLKGTQ